VSSKFVVLSIVCLISSSATGHHSFAPHYDPEALVTISGTVAEFSFRNPHSFVMVEVENAAGATDIWTCETSSATVLTRQGRSGDMVVPGERVRISGAAARRDPTGCRVYTIDKADGSRVRLFGGEPSSEAEVETAPVNAGLFGNWQTIPGTGRLGPDSSLNQHTGPNIFADLLTAAGRAATAQYDPVADDPALSCIPASPWRVWDDPGSLTQIERSDDRIIIRHEVMDGYREILLDRDAHPDLRPAPLGRSIGRLDGDTLYIETTAFSTGVFIPHPGILMSADARLSEQIRFDASTRQLHLTWQLSDPAYYAAPLSGEFTLEGSSLEFERYNCAGETE
jgi:hypothetical protein